MSWFLLEYKQTSRLTQRIAHRADSIAVSYCNKCLDRYNNRARMTPCFLSHRAAPIALNLRVTGLDHVYFSTLSLSISIALIVLHCILVSNLSWNSIQQVHVLANKELHVDSASIKWLSLYSILLIRYPLLLSTFWSISLVMWYRYRIKCQ